MVRAIKKSSLPKIFIGVSAVIIALLIYGICLWGSHSSSYDEYPEESITATTGFINGHEWVDLGLPSGLKWATCNVGATAPEVLGDYFAWGEIATKSAFTEKNSTVYSKDSIWLKNKGYLDENGNLTLSHDAANQNWGAPWRLPTKNEIEELVNFTTSEWTTLKGIPGRLIKSKNNGNSIFLPATDSEVTDEGDKTKEYCFYWSSTQDKITDEIAYVIFIYSKEMLTSGFHQYVGLPVRPVSD